MENKNYQKVLEDMVKNFTYKPTLLLHSCCGPCSTQVINFLKDYFKITIYYYNPNIEPYLEYEKRKQEQIKFMQMFNEEEPTNKIEFRDVDYNHDDYENVVLGLENEPEGGARCNKCFYLRLKKTALEARENNFEYFGTTLTVSPHKNSKIINEIGEALEKDLGIKFIYGDFKKNDGYKKSIDYSKKYNLYRQNYCGCHYARSDINDR